MKPGKEVTIGYNAYGYMFNLSVGTGPTMQTHETLILTDETGVLQLRIPKRIIPAIVTGDTVIVTFGLVKATPVEISAIIKADETDLKFFKPN